MDQGKFVIFKIQKFFALSIFVVLLVVGVLNFSTFSVAADQPDGLDLKASSELFLSVYQATGADNFNPLVVDDLQRVYVPELRGNSVAVIDPETLKVVDRFSVGRSPQHIIPSWDLRTLWVANNAERRTDGSLTPVDPRTGKPGKAVSVDDPYNMYYTVDGEHAIVVAEAKHRLDFRDPKSMQLQYSIETPQCEGINHGDFSQDGAYAIFTCEFDGTLVKIDMANRAVMGYLKLSLPKTRYRDSTSPSDPLESEICTSSKAMPQDIRIAPNGRLFYVADMESDGVHLVDGVTFTEVGFVATGVAAHGLYPARDGKSMYVTNRGSHAIHGKKNGPGSVTVVNFATNTVIANWPIPGGGSPDMGNVSADGKWLWLSGRYDDVVYRFNTASGGVDKIAVGKEPHGLTVWPQPGRYSLGHTGNMR
jgi:YVTN family beta-propeller protein